MEKNLVGYRFSPTGEELINHYLKNKILNNSRLVEDAINEINICDHDPIYLPSLSKLKTNDPEWYFFTPREYYSPGKKKGTKRTTPSGFWKVTGKDAIIKDWRRNGDEIGIKKTLVFHEGKSSKGVRTPWVIHEYHITSLPSNQRNYVICKVKYKVEDQDSGNNSNGLSHSMVSNFNTLRETNTTPEAEQQWEDCMTLDDLSTPLNEQDDPSPSQFNLETFFNGLPFDGGNYDDVLRDDPSQFNPDNLFNFDEFINEQLPVDGGNNDDVLHDNQDTIMRNENRPKKALIGIIDDCSNDSDAESIYATSYQGTSSPDSAHGLRPSKQEVKEGKSRAVDASVGKKSSTSSMVKIEKKSWFIREEAMDIRNCKNPPYIYLMNMIIGFMVLVAIIGNILSVLLNVKT